MTDVNGEPGAGIQSFVIFDTETTGLPLSKPKITELCFLGVKRRDLLDGPLVPRVGDKILLYADPGKHIEIEAAIMTGLNNELLAQEKPFDKDLVQLLCLFLKRLPKPVCLLAHNGNRFDFPLLMSELRQVDEFLPDDLLCADTLPAFKALEPKKTFPGSPGDETSPDKPASERSRDLAGGDGDADDFRPRGSTETRGRFSANLSYRQVEVYKRCFGEHPPESHKAADDCEALLKVVKTFSPEFIEWADENATSFKDITPMY